MKQDLAEAMHERAVEKRLTHQEKQAQLILNQTPAVRNAVAHRVDKLVLEIQYALMSKQQATAPSNTAANTVPNVTEQEIRAFVDNTRAIGITYNGTRPYRAIDLKKLQQNLLNLVNGAYTLNVAPFQNQDPYFQRKHSAPFVKARDFAIESINKALSLMSDAPVAQVQTVAPQGRTVPLEREIN